MAEKILKIKVIPNSKINKIVEKGDNFLKIKLTAPAHEGKANSALLNFLSQEFKIPKSKIKIITGEKSRLKVISII
ncbi:MAG: hypothetical protein A2Y82_01030 [Candidatus Buchananbacteria bacterium RBG_13_36_9]|uniref:UPF0235 protein A2Y82_01030 n=1 Tax=Candidatus Buchananbacteria bacterium RBG_13_36_9 TaxID=1797530 RepID=A0A1G1XPF6_9BACT|nr:MAG: hypothetical protein A2Y82_01030 [Candidatus Buchananbacteria bacterium RBG_13_36_9]